MIDKTVPTPAAAVADIHGRRDRHDRRLRRRRHAVRADRRAASTRARANLTIVNNNAGNGETGARGAAQGAARAQDHLLVSAAGRFARVRRACIAPARSSSSSVPQGNLAERIRAAGAGIGALLHADRLRDAAGRGQGNARHRRPQLRARVPDPRRLRADQGRARRPLGQSGLPQDRAQLRADHGAGGEMRDRAGARGGRAGRRSIPKSIVTPGIFVQRVVADRRRRPSRVEPQAAA